MPVLQLPTERANVVDRVSFQSVLANRLSRVGPRGFTVIGLIAFALALFVSLPASLMLKLAGVDAANAVGTLWEGEAAIGDQTAVSWRVRPLRSLLKLGLVSDVRMRGGETDLSAVGVWRPGRLTLETVSGLAGSGLMNTLIKDLPIQCDLSFAVNLDRIVIAGPRSGAVGDVRSGPGRCTARNGIDTGPAEIPALVGRAAMDANGSSAWLAPGARPEGGRLAQMTIDRKGKLTASVLDAGALMLPATAGRMAIEVQL